MQFHQKNIMCTYNSQLLLLPITGALFVKKPVLIRSLEENTLDFHLDMIKKIDALLQKHDHETPTDEPKPMGAPHTVPQQLPVEVRPPLERRPGYVEPELPRVQEISFPKNRIVPEEFKTDTSLGTEPEFKFITSLDSVENALHIRPHLDDRIEVIDLGEFITDDIPSRLNTPIIIAGPHPQQKLQIIKQANDDIQPSAVLDTRVLNQKKYQNVFLSAAKQKEEIEKKAQVYYHRDSKTKKNDFTQTYVPDDFESRLQVLKKKIQQEEEQKQETPQKQQGKEEQKQETSQKRQDKEEQKQEKSQQQDKKEQEKLRKQFEKGEKKKRALDEKIKKRLEKELRKQLGKEREKTLRLELDKIKSEEKKLKEEKEEPKQETPSVSLTKKQLKEQRRLERIAARQAIFEERLKIKKEKRILKEKKKHLELIKSDTIEKYTPAPAELDTDIKKILQITDELLGELPEEVINRFMRSDEYDLYERILNKYKVR
jgi:hypothetical protein